MRKVTVVVEMSLTKSTRNEWSICLMASRRKPVAPVVYKLVRRIVEKILATDLRPVPKNPILEDLP